MAHQRRAACRGEHRFDAWVLGCDELVDGTEQRSRLARLGRAGEQLHERVEESWPVVRCGNPNFVVEPLAVKLDALRSQVHPGAQFIPGAGVVERVRVSGEVCGWELRVVLAARPDVRGTLG